MFYVIAKFVLGYNNINNNQLNTDINRLSITSGSSNSGSSGGSDILHPTRVVKTPPIERRPFPTQCDFFCFFCFFM